LTTTNQTEQTDDRAFEILFKEYFKPLSVYAKKYLNDLDLAQDLVQEVFVKFYEQRTTLTVHTSVKALLYQSVKNRCLDYIRSQQTRTAHHDNILHLSGGNDIDAVDYMEQVELEERVYKAIADLPEQCQLIFKLSRLEGKRNQEIADELNLSKRTVETQISNALKRLRKDIFSYIKLLIVMVLGL
jgi:RNA polymerase sigma-70 factor (ECF subfamily)